MEDQKSEEVKESRSPQIKDWFHNKFLAVYENQTRVDEAERYLCRYQPEDNVLDEIYRWVVEDNRARKKCRERGMFYGEAPNCFTFFHTRRWKDKIKSYSDAKIEQPEVEALCKCGRKATQQESTCARCWSDKYAAEGPTGENVLRGAWKSTPPPLPGESGRDHFIRVHGDPKKYGLGSDQGKRPDPVQLDEGPFEYGPEDDWHYG